MEVNMRAKGTERLLDVLCYVAAQQAPLTRNAIATALNAPRSTIYTIVDMLVEREFLSLNGDSGRVVPGRLCGLLGIAYENSAPLISEAREIVTELANNTGEVAELDVLHEWQQLILITRSGRGQAYRGASEGTRIPLPHTASARLLLDGRSFADIRRCIPPRHFDMPTGGSTTPEELFREIGQARKQGYWVTRGLVASYITCIAAPVRSAQGACIGAVCLVLPQPTFVKKEAEAIRSTCASAEKLSRLCALRKMPSF